MTHQDDSTEPRFDPATDATGVPAHNTPVSILIVDDDPDCRLLIRDAIAESTVSNAVYEVSSAQEAWQFLCRQNRFADAPRPGLIYLDVEMPGVDGIQLLRQIRANPALRDISVVMVTGVTDETQMRAALAAGANSYTLKPANAQQFLRTIVECTRYWLTIHQRPEQHLPAYACRR